MIKGTGQSADEALLLDDALFADAAVPALAAVLAEAALAALAGEFAEAAVDADPADAAVDAEAGLLAVLAEAGLLAVSAGWAKSDVVDAPSVTPGGTSAPLSIGAATAVPVPMPRAAIVPTASHFFFRSFIVVLLGVAPTSGAC